MAVTVTTPNFTLEANAACDSGTGSSWTASSGPVEQTTAGIYREADGCHSMQGSASDEESYVAVAVANDDFSNRTVFGWMINGSPGTEANIGFGILIGDGSNDRVYAVGGKDNFGHFVKGWASFRLNCANLPATFRNTTGAGAPTITTISRLGYGMNYATTAFGKIANMFYDVIRHIDNASPALVIAGGGVGTEGKWAEIADDDLSETSGKAYGVCRTLISGSKAYELRFGVQFGLATGNQYFKDSNFQLFMEGTNMAAGSMDVTLLAGSGTQVFDLSDGVITGVGEVSNWDLSAAYDTVILNRMTCTDLGAITFPAGGGTTRESIDSTYNNCGQISIGNNFPLQGATFNGSSNANGALLLDNILDDTNINGLTFNSDGAGHAIYITATGTYDLTDFKFNDYGADDTTDAVVYNNSGGAVTLNLFGSDTPTVRNGTGASTSIVSSYSFTVEGLELNTEVTIVTANTSTELFHVENASVSDGNGKYKITYTHSGGGTVDVLIMHVDYEPDVSNIYGLTLPSADSSALAKMTLDPNYFNP